MKMKFEIYITRKSLNGNAVAKYTNGHDVRLAHELNGRELNSITMVHEEYERMIEEIESMQVDALAWILDTKFNCNML